MLSSTYLTLLVSLLYLVAPLREDADDVKSDSMSPTSLVDGGGGVPTALKARFNNFEVLGQGSFGKVWKAVSTTQTDKVAIGDEVAIKVPTNGTTQKDLQIKCSNIQYMTDRLADVNHVMQCYDTGAVYAVLQFAGANGNKALQGVGPDEVLGIFKQVLLALHAMQRADPPFIHHDLKWDNVAVDNKKCLRLIDIDEYALGIWEERKRFFPYSPIYAPPEASKRNSFYCGLNANPAPEQKARCPGSYTFDIYSAGMMLFEACAFDWMYYTLHWEGARNKIAAVADLRYWAEGGPIHESIPFIGLNTLKRRWKKVGDLTAGLKQFNTNKLGTMIESMKRYAPDMNEDAAMQASAKAVAMLEKCKTFDDKSLKQIEQMITQTPKERPTPAEMLDASFLKDLSTGCSLDATAVPVASSSENDETRSQMTEFDQDAEDEENGAKAQEVNELNEELERRKANLLRLEAELEQLLKQQAQKVEGEAAQDVKVVGEFAIQVQKEKIEVSKVESRKEAVDEQRLRCPSECGGNYVPRRNQKNALVKDKMGNVVVDCIFTSYPARKIRECTTTPVFGAGKYKLQCKCKLLG